MTKEFLQREAAGASGMMARGLKETGMDALLEMRDSVEDLQ